LEPGLDEAPEDLSMTHRAVPALKFDRRTIIANILALFSGSVVAQGMTSVALLLTARQLGADSYGQYAAAYVLTGFASIAFNLGLDIWLLREGSRVPESLAEYLGSVLAIKLGIGLIWFALLSAAAPHMNGLLNSSAFAPDLLRLSAISVWLDCMLASLLTSYKARLANRMTSLLQVGARGAWLLGTFILMSASITQAHSYMLLRVLVLATSVALTLALVAHTTGYRVTPITIRRVLGEAPPFAASEFLAWASMRVDTLIIALTLGQRQVGLYSPAVGIVNALYVVPATVYAVVMPVLSRSFALNQAQAWATTRRMLLVLLALGIVLTLGTVAASGLMPVLLGDSYQGTGSILAILSTVLLLHALTFGVAAVLIATNQQSRRVVAQGIAVGSNVVLNLLIVPIYGIRGAAFVYVFTEIVLLAGYAWFAYRAYRAPARLSSVDVL
jgi:O-antigen/teichoic acid export membrane protein